MSRIRTIKPEFFKHEELFDAEVETGLPLRLSFAGLWTQCDREGRFVWRPRQLKADILPYDDVDFSRVLDALATRGFIVKYASADRSFGYVPSWNRHQVINNRESASSLPNPIDIIAKTDASATRHPRVRHDGKVEGKGKEGKEEPNGSLSGTSPDPAQRPKAKSNYSEAFEAFWLAYPRSPNMSKVKAFDGWKKLTEPERKACHDAVSAYRSFLASKPDHPTMHAATFINERRFEGFAAGIATTAADEDAQWPKRLAYARSNKTWSTSMWGPGPGQRGCRVPTDLLNESDGDGWREWEQAA
ncbi:hypothetical protein [Mesorhizobium temperatum]|uniref:Uncharacterized protein n=1 Tax=Mesorhizobium temperatum TaxID=241416 RepID=A0A271LNS5_9HYPH|nr:hypothetical protein [Mesorhizobium temperatum]PAQ09724.1 hypothetical protein CIT26_11835 [Mesorhizobium temperatum]